MAKMIVQSALYTVLFLFGGMLVGVAVGNFVFNALPGHSVVNPSGLHISIAALPTLLGLLAGAGLWGAWMAKVAKTNSRRRMIWAGALGFAPITIVLVIALSLLEPIAVEQLGAQFPIHRIFTFFFVPTAFVIAGVSAWAIGIGLRDNALATSLLWRVGLAAAVAFLAINLALESAGWRVGGPNAAARLTMLTVMFASNLAAALVGGGVLGWLLATKRRTA